jgi:hypothetical protein
MCAAKRGRQPEAAFWSTVLKQQLRRLGTSEWELHRIRPEYKNHVLCARQAMQGMGPGAFIPNKFRRQPLNITSAAFFFDLM